MGFFIPKEKVLLNNKRDDLFSTHPLMRQKYYSYGRKVMKEIEKKFPELLI